MKKAYLALFLGVALGVAHGQPPISGYQSDGSGGWTPLVSSATAGALISTPPPQSLYCYNTSLKQWVPFDSSCVSGGSATPSGPAGGDLGGTYPNPSVVGLNGISLAGLATGFLFNTTGTGVPSSIGFTGTGNVVRAASPTVSDPTVTGSLTATGLVTNADLANPATTVNGQTCTLGSSCTIPLSAINPQTATYQVLAGDFSNSKTITVASGTFAITLVASGTQPAAGQYINIINYGTGVVTVARSGQNINGGTASLTLPVSAATTPTSTTIFSDGTNYFAAASTGAFAGAVSSGNSFTSTRSDNVWFAAAGNTTAALELCNSSFSNCMTYVPNTQVLTVPGSTGNVTAPRLISNIATGTAPLTVTSTTPVANLTVTNLLPSGKFVASGQTAATAAQTLVTTTATSTYQVNAVVTCDTTVAAATVTLTVAYTDPSSTAQTVTPSAAACTALGASSSANVTQTIRAKTGTTITVATAISGSPNYDIAATALQITSN